MRDQKLRIHVEPGERFSYSGEGMTLFQVVIQKVTGKSLEELMQAYVFAAYGMTMSSYTWQPRFEADYAVGHAVDRCYSLRSLLSDMIRVQLN